MKKILYFALLLFSSLIADTLEVDFGSFSKQILETPVSIIYIYLNWDENAQMTLSTFEQLATDTRDYYKCIKMSYSRENDLFLKLLGISAFPSFLVFAQGQKKGVVCGTWPLQELKKRIEDILSPDFAKLTRYELEERFISAIMKGDNDTIERIMETKILDQQTLMHYLEPNLPHFIVTQIPRPAMEVLRKVKELGISFQQAAPRIGDALINRCNDGI